MKNVEIYTFATCPFSIKAKGLLDKNEVVYTEHVIDEAGLKELSKKTGHPTVPQLFIDGKLIGGYSDLKEVLKNDQLDHLLGR